MGPALLVASWVLLVETDDTARLDDAVRAAAQHRIGLRFISPEEAFVEGGLEAESGLSSCGNDTGCLASRLRHVRADFALLLVVRRVAGEHLIALRAVRATNGELLHRALIQARARDQIASSTTKIVNETFDALGYARGGELIVTVEPANAELLANDQPIIAGRPQLLPKGTYALRARLADHDDAIAEVRLDEGATQEVKLVLAPRPAGWVERPWFWVGVGVAATALGVAIGVAASGGERCFCAAPDPSACGSCP